MIDFELAAHDGVLVEIANCRGSGIGIGKLNKAKAFGAPGLIVMNEAEADNGTNGTEELKDGFFGKV